MAQKNGQKKQGQVCDKCGRPVPRDNDAVAFEMCLSRDLSLIGAAPRHLLPVVEKGVVVCRGSPSRAQYLLGQKRDTRPAYKYQPDLEASYRRAYEQMLEDAAGKAPAAAS